MNEEQLVGLRKKYFIHLTGVESPSQLSEREKIIINQSFDFFQREMETSQKPGSVPSQQAKIHKSEIVQKVLDSIAPEEMAETERKMMEESVPSCEEQPVSVNENILCAAIWYDDGKEYRMQPTNIKSGIVVSGHRHPHCKVILMSWLYPNWENDTLQENMKNEVNNKEVQGFLTSKCRFIDRVEAAKLWQEQGNKLKYSSYELFSEDLY